MKLQEKYGGVFKVMIFHEPRLVLAEHKFVEYLLSSSINKKSNEYSYLHKWLGTGLLTSYGAKWKGRRKLITPAFHFKILEEFIDIFHTQTDILIAKLQKEVDGASFDIFPYITLCALDVICEAAMGTQVNAQMESESKYVISVREMCRITITRGISPIKMVDTFFKFSRDYQKQQKALEVLHGYTNFVIKKKRQEMQNTVTNIASTDDCGIKTRLAFLDLLLQSTVDGKPLSDEDVREEVDTFMFEGHDTTTSGISFTLYCLSKYPAIQDKVVEELREICNNKDEPQFTYRDLQNMKYLEMVIKESLRLYPPVPYISRVLEEDVEYENQMLLKDLGIGVSVIGLHRQSDVFPDPLKFDPERFSHENAHGRSPFAYIPFSAGARNCIGQRFAILELKATIAKILVNYELLPVHEHTPILSFELILKSINGLPLRLKKRTF